MLCVCFVVLRAEFREKEPWFENMCVSNKKKKTALTFVYVCKKIYIYMSVHASSQCINKC